MVLYAGGLVVVAGRGTKARFISTVLLQCCLVVINGACATLEGCRLSASQELDCSSEFGSGICVFAKGECSTVNLQAGSITGGLRGIIVTSGASLVADSVKMTGNSWVAIESQGSGTTVNLLGSTLSGSTCTDSHHLPTGNSTPQPWTCCCHESHDRIAKTEHTLAGFKNCIT